MAARPTATPFDFHAFFRHCSENGYAPASCLREGARPVRLAAGRALAGASEEALFRERMPDIVADIAACLRRDARTCAMARALYVQSLEGALDREVLLWLDACGYSLDWLFFGLGGMLLAGYRGLAPQGAESPLRTEDVRRLRCLAPGWSGADWGWLHGNRHLRRREAPPAMAIAAAAVVAWGIPPFVPALPDPAATCRRIRDLAMTIDHTSWKRDDWHAYVIRRLKASPARAGMLAGVSATTAAAYMAGSSTPTDGVLRTFLVLDFVLSRHGRDGLIDLLDLLDEEARSRGFEDLGAVFRARSWRPREASPDRGTDGRP